MRFRISRRPLVLTAASFGLTALLLVIFWASRGVGVLVATDTRRQGVLLCEQVAPGDEFVVDYTHSSERIPVSTRFAVVTGGQISIVETAFASFGPGLPELQQGEEYEITGGMIRQRHHGRRLAELSFFVHPFTEHRLHVKGRTVDLSRQVAAGGLVKIRVESMKLPWKFFGRWVACPSAPAGPSAGEPGA